MKTADLMRELKADEGEVLEVYLCSAGHKTVGVGHKLVPTDPEYDWPVGAPITQERSDELLERDLSMALADAYWTFTNWDELPDEAQLVLANMAFNLGRSRLSKFAKMKRAVESFDFNAAADEMQDSLWARQLPARSGRLISRMRDV